MGIVAKNYISPYTNKKEYERQKELATVSRLNYDPIKAEQLKEQLKAQSKKANNSWFNTSAFDDGYQFGDITKTIFSTGGDIGLDLLQGGLNTIEGITDTGTYLLADIVDFFGADNVAKSMRENADFNSFGAWFGENEEGQNLLPKGWQEGIEENSILGGKSDQVVQSIGQIGGYALTGGVLGGGVTANNVVIFSSAYGNAKSEAKRNGASESDAIKKALVSATAETISENLFDAMPFVKSSGFGDKVIGKFFNKKVGKVTGAILNSFEEGSEEIISNLLDVAGTYAIDYIDKATGGKGWEYGMQNLSGDIKKDLKDTFMSEETWEAFFSAALSTALVGAGHTAISNTRMNNAINSYAKENNVSVEQAKKDFETVLGGVVEEYKTDDMSVKKQYELENQLKGQLSKSVKQGLNLSEVAKSVRTDQENQNYKFEFTQGELKTYKDNKVAQNIMEKVQNSDINNTKKAHEIVKTAIKVAEELNVNVDFTNNSEITQQLIKNRQQELGRELTDKEKAELEKYASQINGMKLGNNILLNTDSKQSAKYTLGHELKHFLEQNSKLNEELNEKLIEWAKTKGVYDTDFANMSTLYKQVQNANIIDELTANYTAEFFSSEANMKAFATENPGLFTKIANYFKKLYYKTTNQKEKLLIQEINEKIQKVYSEVAKERANLPIDRTSKANIGENTKFMIATDGNKQWVKADRQVIKGDNPDVWAEQVENYINDKIRNNEDVTVYGQDGKPLTITSNTAGKATFRNYVNMEDGSKRLMTDEEYATKLRAETHIDELAKISKDKNKHKPDFKDHDFAKDGFDYRTAYFEDEDGKYYRITMSVGVNGNINTIYNVGEIKPSELKTQKKETGKLNGSKAKPVSLVNNISQTKENVKSDVNLPLAEQLERQGTRILEEAENKRLGMIENFKEYLEENDITNPTQEDIDNSLTDILGYDNDEFSDNAKNEKLYNQYVREYMKENGIPFNDQKNETPKFSLSTENNNIRDRAKEEIGLTTNLNEAGYLTDDGNYLDFSGKRQGAKGGQRQMDHRDIVDIYSDGEYDAAEKKYSNMGSATAIMQDFIDRGNIRLNGTGVEIAVEPTQEQYSKLYDYLEHVQKDNGDVFIDLDTETNNRENLEYNSKTSISKMINDIKKHYSKQKVQYSLSQDNQGRELSKQQQDYFKDVSPEVKDNNGNLMTFYHGSNSEFTIFDINKAGESNKNARVGFWFTPSKQGAENFANDVWYGDKKPTTYEVYLNLKNPKVYESYDNSQQTETLREEYKKSQNKEKALYEKHEYDNIGMSNVIAFLNYKSEENTIKTLVNDFGYTEAQAKEYIEEAKQIQEIRKETRRLEREVSNSRYTDSYEQFRTDIYKFAGKDAEDANFGGLGMMLNNEKQVVQDYVDSLKEQGYDGIVIKNTRFDAENMGGNNDQYVAFYPNQIKNVDNLNPTEDADIRYQLGKQNTTLQDVDKTSLSDLKVKDKNAKPNLPITETNLPTAKKVRVPKTDAEKRVRDKVKKAIENQSYKAVNIATKTGQKYLDFDRQQKAEFKEALSKYIGKTQQQLTNAKTWNDIKELVSNYANKEITYVDEELKSIKNEIRKQNIKITDDLKNQITDYGDFRRSVFGKLKLGDTGTSVDSLYQELSEQYPYYFGEATTQQDMLYEIADFMNQDVNTVQKFRLDDETIDEAVTKTYNALMRNAMTKDSVEELTAKLEAKMNERTRAVIQEELLNDMGVTLQDISKGKDIKAIDMFRTDPIRLNEKVFGNETGNKINDATIRRTKHNEAERTRWLNQERNEIKDLGIKARSKESAAVQKYGEKQYVNEHGEVMNYGDAELAKEFSDIETQEKIKKAAQVLRNKYDMYIDQINNSLVNMGYKPIQKRNDYMRHFQALNDVFSRFGTPLNKEGMQNNALPTDINGLTDQFKPGKQYFASALQRLGMKTEYDAITGIDGYLEGASNLIYHTEDIQRYRTLAKLIRNTYGTTHGYEDFATMTPEQQTQRIEDIQSNKLSKYAAWLDEQANALAGKKGGIDRAAERMLGRKVYNVLDTAKKQVGSNMTGYNVRSAMTNFASAVQGASKTNKLAFIKGTISTINNIIHDDGLIDKSDFLTSRLSNSKSLSQKAWQKASAAGQIFMSGTDWFTANQIWRSKYYENLQNGMSENEAIKQADDFASRIMGDRSKGATAEAFNSKTLGFFTQFQLEVNNQWSSLIHDNKMDIQNGTKSVASMIFQTGQLFGLAYLFNGMMKALTGSKVMLDPIELFKKIFAPDDDDDKTMDERAREALGDVIDDLPFVSFMTGGRIPVKEAFKGAGTFIDYATGKKNDYGQDITLEDVKNDVIESAAYWLLPTGYGQIRKTTKGLGMYDENLPIAGSYTKSGRLRFEAEDTTAARVQAALFGEYSSQNAREYLDKGYQPLTENQIQEAVDSGLKVKDYRKYSEGLKEQETTEDKVDYIANLPYSMEQKNVLVNNVLKRNEDIDLTNYNNYGSLAEFDYANKNPEKYAAIKQITSYDKYLEYQNGINNIKSQYSDTNTRKAAIRKYINSLKLNKYQKIMLQKLAGGYSIKSYENEMFNYINGLNMTKKEKETLHKELFG